MDPGAFLIVSLGLHKIVSLGNILLTQLGKKSGDISKTLRVFHPPGTHIIILPETQAVPNSSFTLNLLPGYGLPRPKSVTPNKLDNVSVLG